MAGDQNYPISSARFVAEYLRGSPDEVWSRLIVKSHGHQNKTPEEWGDVIESYRAKPAHPTVLNR